METNKGALGKWPCQDRRSANVENRPPIFSMGGVALRVELKFLKLYKTHIHSWHIVSIQ